MEQLDKAEEKRQEMKKRAQEANDDVQIVWEDGMLLVCNTLKSK